MFTRLDYAAILEAKGGFYMGAIMESLFSIAYLTATAVLGILMVKQAKSDRQRLLFGILTLVLVGGDSFHLVPRIYGNLTGKLSELYTVLGFGTLVTSITMTVFYVLVYHFWCGRYKKQIKSTLTAVVYILALARIGLCLFPQNDWLSADAPLAWGIYRNIPFALLGGLMVYLFFNEAQKTGDKLFKYAWLAILFSFLFYLPVVLLAGSIPVVGVLMLPKTACYVWLVTMGFRDKINTINYNKQ